MKRIRSVQYSLIVLMFLNFLAVLYNSLIYVQATNYVLAKEEGYTLLQELQKIPDSPDQVFWSSMIFLAGIVMISCYRMTKRKQEWSIYDKWNIVEIFLMIGLLWAQHFAYNGIVLFVFADIFYGSKEFSGVRDRRYWIAFIFLSFMILLVTNYDLLSLFVKLPSLETYISFYPMSVKIMVLFLKNALLSLNIIVFIVSLLFYSLFVVNEHHQIERELAMVSRVNTELNSYMALSEKIAEDRERKRIAREIHDTLGHALTGISAGIDAVGVLIDLDPSRAKEQLKSVSAVVREAIRDVRGSLNRLRPRALENHTLKDALMSMIAEYEAISKLRVQLVYEWDDVDLDVMQEDTIFRVIQESMTNSIRHGHATEMSIQLLDGNPRTMLLRDNGVGFSELTFGYGLKQMKERISILGGQIRFTNQDGFQTEIVFPKREGGVNNDHKSHDSR